MQGAGTWASLTIPTPPPRVMARAGQVAVPLTSGLPGKKCLLFLPTEAVLGGAQEQGVVVPAGKGDLSSCGPCSQSGVLVRLLRAQQSPDWFTHQSAESNILNLTVHMQSVVFVYETALFLFFSSFDE